LYVIDIERVVWRLGDSVEEIARLEASDCVMGSGHHVVYELYSSAVRPEVIVLDLRSGRRTMLDLPGASACGGLGHSGQSGIIARTSAEYEPIVLFTSSTTELWENPLRSENGLAKVLTDTVLSDEGDRLLALSNSSALALFNVLERRLIGEIPLGGMSNFKISADGTKVLTFGYEVGLLRWSLDPEEWANTAEQLITRSE
jgi:hypothetical protein